MMFRASRDSFRATLFAISLTAVGRFDFTAPEPARPPAGTSSDRAPGDAASLIGPEGLSGITWLGRAKYLAVSDRHAALFPLTIRVDSTSGAIIDARFDDPIRLRDEWQAFERGLLRHLDLEAGQRWHGRARACRGRARGSRVGKLAPCEPPLRQGHSQFAPDLGLGIPGKPPHRYMR